MNRRDFIKASLALLATPSAVAQTTPVTHPYLDNAILSMAVGHLGEAQTFILDNRERVVSDDQLRDWMDGLRPIRIIDFPNHCFGVVRGTFSDARITVLRGTVELRKWNGRLEQMGRYTYLTPAPNKRRP